MPLTQVLQGEARYDLVMRYLPQFRPQGSHRQFRLLAPTGERVSLAQLTDVQDRRRRLGDLSRRQASATSPSSTACATAISVAPSKRPSARSTPVKLPAGYKIDWAGEYESQKRSVASPAVIAADHPLVIFIILYMMFHSGKWAMLIWPPFRWRPWRPARAAAHAHQLQRLVRRRLPGAVRRLGRNRRHHARIHQPAPRPRPNHRGRGHRGRCAPPPSHHDDHARRHAGPAARRHSRTASAPTRSGLSPSSSSAASSARWSSASSCCPPSTSGSPAPKTSSPSPKPTSKIEWPCARVQCPVGRHRILLATIGSSSRKPNTRHEVTAPAQDARPARQHVRFLHRCYRSESALDSSRTRT